MLIKSLRIGVFAVLLVTSCERQKPETSEDIEAEPIPGVSLTNLIKSDIVISRLEKLHNLVPNGSYKRILDIIEVVRDPLPILVPISMILRNSDQDPNSSELIFFCLAMDGWDSSGKVRFMGDDFPLTLVEKKGSVTESEHLEGVAKIVSIYVEVPSEKLKIFLSGEGEVGIIGSQEKSMKYVCIKPSEDVVKLKNVFFVDQGEYLKGIRGEDLIVKTWGED